MSGSDEDRSFNRSIISEFRTNGGRVRGWEDLLLLTTIGARSGQPRTTPLGYSIDAGRIIVFAADQGASTHPSWYHNLVAQPEVTVELGRRRWHATAVVVHGQERERLLSARAKVAPWIVGYQRKTTREIPVVALTGWPA